MRRKTREGKGGRESEGREPRRVKKRKDKETGGRVVKGLREKERIRKEKERVKETQKKWKEREDGMKKRRREEFNGEGGKDDIMWRGEEMEGGDYREGE